MTLQQHFERARGDLATKGTMCAEDAQVILGDPTKRAELTSIPDWAMPNAWKELERTLKKAERQYRKHQVVFERLAMGKFLIIATDDADVFEIADTELAVDDLWKSNHGEREAAIFQIGSV